MKYKNFRKELINAMKSLKNKLKIKYQQDYFFLHL